MPDLKAAVVPVTPFQQNCVILWEEPGKRAVGCGSSASS